VTQPLTPIERRVYHFLLDFLSENTYQPSIREIGRRFRIKSTKTVSDLLQSLAAKGYIERDPSRSRGVRLVGYKGLAGTQPVPYYGKIHAGEPALLPEHRVGHITMDRRFVPSDQTFFFKIQGDSMIGRGINDGDFVMVDPTREPEEGAVVAARLGDEATVKTLTHRGGATVLVPANPDEREIVVAPGDDFAVLGVVSGIFRPLFDGHVPLPTAETAEAVAAEVMAIEAGRR
jgi:repressor LexA